MKTATVAAALALAALGVAPAAAEDLKPVKVGPATEAPYVHVVIFTMKKDAPADAVEKAVADCHDLLAKIPSVRSLRAGRPADKGTPDLAKKNYDFALVILVDDFAGLEAYLKHESHLKFVEKHGRHFDMEKLQVFDFLNAKK
jgi:hypothetical protein